MAHCESGYLSHAFGVLALAVCIGCGDAATTGAGERVPADERLVFTDVTETAGLGGFLHNSGSMGEKWYPGNGGCGRRIHRLRR